MDCRVTWLGNGGMTFTAETGSGHLVNMDGAPEAGGRNRAPRPMELILAGAGGRSAFDEVVSILQKARQAVSGCEVAMHTPNELQKTPKSSPKSICTLLLKARI